MATADILPHLLSIDELAEHLGITKRHVRRLVAERRVPYYKVGRFIRFDPGEITVWLDNLRVPGGLVDVVSPMRLTCGAIHIE